ncbi:type II secretion system protein [Sulfurimonas sp. HSL-1716]|uniref:type IV pilin protein n=1 Tax=Hydrocurvibacter sulfurireducens TaxID=3131937 RepID=UPI0031F8D58B
MKRGAFTLVELMIVVLIIGIVYTLVIVNFKTKESDEKPLSLEKLKSYLQHFHFKSQVRLLCLDECNECEVIVDGNETARLKHFVDKSIEMYRYDPLRGMVLLDESYYDKEQERHHVCFSYTMYKNGVGDQIAAVYKNQAYDFTPYLETVKVYESINELQSAKEEKIEELKR